MTLAEKNNNPLNIRPLPNGEQWQGQVGVDRNPTTGRFCVFESNTKGVRAAVVNMRSYVKFSGVRTLRGVIYRWAPPPAGGITGTPGSAVGGVDQNHTEAYLASVCKETGVSPEFDVTVLTFPTTSDAYRDKVARIVRAMNRVEAGKHTITIDEARAGVDEALNVPRGYVRRDDDNVVRRHLPQSKSIQLNTGGQASNLIGTGVSVVSAFSVIEDWRIAAIVAGLALVVGAAVGYYFYRLRKDRADMHRNGIA